MLILWNIILVFLLSTQTNYRTKEDFDIMLKKKVSRLIFLLGAAGFALFVFFCPASSLPAQAATPPDSTAQPLMDDIRYRFVIYENKMYKRLYNYSTCNWIGDWIYVCDIEQP